jgi:hypothetical protein
MNSCKHDEWFERDPKSMITDDQLWNSPTLLTSLLANYYNRLPVTLLFFSNCGRRFSGDVIAGGS